MELLLLCVLGRRKLRGSIFFLCLEVNDQEDVFTSTYCFKYKFNEVTVKYLVLCILCTFGFLNSLSKEMRA